MSNLQAAIRQCETTQQMLENVAAHEPVAAEFGGSLMNAIDALRDVTGEMRVADAMKYGRIHDTKDMSTLMEVAKMLGQIGTAGAAMYVGAGAARDTYDALKAKCREMMDKLDEAQSQLDNIDPRELDAGMRSAPNLNETKSFDQIMNWLYAAGIVFLGGTMLWDNRDRFTARIDDAIEAVREAIMYMRYGSTLEDLQRAIDTLQSAGIQVPGDIQRIAIDPREGNDSEIPSTNIAMARAWLDSALQHLQEAQARAQNMPDEQRSDPHPVSVKSGAHAFYR